MRPSIIVMGIAALTASTALVSCGDDDDARQSVSGAEAGSEVTVDVGEEFEIRLESNPTTGYAWRIVGQPDVIVLVSSDYEEPEASLVGAGGVEVFVFEGATEGSGELRLEYVRSFEDPAVPAETAVYQVKVIGS